MVARRIYNVDKRPGRGKQERLAFLHGCLIDTSAPRGGSAAPVFRFRYDDGELGFWHMMRGGLAYWCTL